MKRPKIEDYNNEDLFSVATYSKALEKYADWLEGRLEMAEKLIDAYPDQKQQIKELEKQRRISDYHFSQSCEDNKELERQIKELEDEYKRISKELTDKVETIHKYLKQIKALEEEVDFWKSLATELEDRQALK